MILPERIDDETEEETQNEHYSSYPILPNAWIYIAIDIRDLDICKIGLTTKKTPQLRINEGKTYNPFLELFTTYELSKCTWGCSREELRDIEKYFHNRHIFGGAIKYPGTGRTSEWFFTSPSEAEYQIDWMLAKRGFSVEKKPLYEIYERTDRDLNRLNYIRVEAMKKIKTIYRPLPEDYEYCAENSRMASYQYERYIKFLEKFHNGDWIDKIYLKQ